MAPTHEEEEQKDIAINAKRNLTEDEEEEEEDDEDQNWDDWEAENDDVEADGSNSHLLCLFCDSEFDSPTSLFQHCASAHHFDFYDVKRKYALDFYRCFKLINFIRSRVAENRCWICGMSCQSKQDLQNHLHHVINFEEGVLPWDDNNFLRPVLQDDVLLYSFDEDDDNDDGDGISVDMKELVGALTEFEQITIEDEGPSDRYTSELTTPSENGGKEVECASGKGVNGASPLGRSTTNDNTDIECSISSLKDMGEEHVNVSAAKVVANQIKSINKNYFGSYSSFGIHREMISDKARTDAYRQAILDNPSLLKGAVVMDVGCGTGILSLFAAQAGASRVIAVEASEKMAAVATQIAKDNGLLRSALPSERIRQDDGVIEVVQGMVEELVNAKHIQPHSVDVLVSEWMGYCLLYESMLSSVLFARDRWLKPGGAILPDTATMFVAGFGIGGTSIPFWENVYGFNMSCVGREVAEDAAQFPIVDVINSCDIVTTAKALQTFDLVIMQPDEMDFTATVDLEPKLATHLSNSTSPEPGITWCYGVVLWFETGFTERFCREMPTILSTSPYDTKTHWSQTILSFREPIAITSGKFVGEKAAAVGSYAHPATSLQSRISVVRAAEHRSIDISMELSCVSHDGGRRNWPAQFFNLK